MSEDPRDGSFRADAGTPCRLDRLLKAFRPAASWSEVRAWIARGKVSVDGEPSADPGRRIVAGTAVSIRMATARVRAEAAPALDRSRLLFVDRDLVVVDKPPGLDSVPWGDGVDALDRRLAAMLGAAVRVVHRLDRDTSGAMMFARSAEAEGRLAHQLRRHDVHRRYLALAHGEVAAATIRTFLADDRGDGLRGSVANARIGKEAITHVEPVERLRAATLVACRLETGRTHQIRIHLAERGHMLLGERGYLREHRGDQLPAPRIMLHAAELGFVHPISGAALRFCVPLPGDMAAVVQQLRAAPPGS